MKKLLISTTLIMLAIFCFASFSNADALAPVKWREAASTNDFWYVASFWSQHLIVTSSIPNTQVVVAMTDTRWEHAATQNAVKNFFKLYGRGKKDLTLEDLTDLTNSLPSDIAIAFNANSYQFLTDLGLEPIPTEE